MASNGPLSVVPRKPTKRSTSKAKDAKNRLSATLNYLEATKGPGTFRMPEVQPGSARVGPTHMEVDGEETTYRTSRQTVPQVPRQVGRNTPTPACRQTCMEEVTSQLLDTKLEGNTGASQLPREAQRSLDWSVKKIDSIRNKYPSPREQIPIFEREILLLECIRSKTDTIGLRREIALYKQILREQTGKVRKIDELVGPRD